MNVTLVQTRDHSKATVQFITRTHSGSYVGISMLNEMSYYLMTDNEITPSRILKSLYKLEPFTKYDNYFLVYI